MKTERIAPDEHRVRSDRVGRPVQDPPG
jgi:hypothetical protein